MRKIFGVLMALMLVVGGMLGFAAPGAQVNAETETSYQNPVYARGGGTYEGVFEETITYAYREVDYYYHNPKLPGYATSLTCGIVAGGNIVAWYNRTNTQLIPGHTPGYYLWGTWVWASGTAVLATAFSQLYTDMNATSAGVTINGYLNGMNTYATGKGMSFSSSNVMGTGGALLNSNYKTEIRNGKLMTIFIDGFNIMDTGNLQSYPSQGYDTVDMEVYAGAHAMAVYGFREVSYYNAQNTMFRKDIYLYVHTGFGGLMGMTMITTHTTLDDAYITHIY